MVTARSARPWCRPPTCLRPVAALLAEVTAFMTLQPGDVLTLGVAANAPLARIGQTAVVEIDGLGRLCNPVMAEGSRA
jgi:5-oxopent-3-ene-1,2,5-tricarboxylate decarboxylase / 2-hydroxyhepta-2,4-diene-1,7-dioate isomerase